MHLATFAAWWHLPPRQGCGFDKLFPKVFLGAQEAIPFCFQLLTDHEFRRSGLIRVVQYVLVASLLIGKPKRLNY